MIKVKPLSHAIKASLMLAICIPYPTAYAETQKSYPQLQQLIKASKYTQAYQQAKKLHLDNEGDPRFDFLYGLAALQTGHYNEAVYALERVVNNEPTVIRPRIELSRAYLKQKNDSAAIRELEYIRTLKPTPQINQQVSTYIQQIKARDEVSRKAVISSLVSFSLGYADNINFGFDNEEIRLPIFGLTLLDGNAVQQKSGFAETHLQMNYRKKTSSRTHRYGTATLHHREYFKTSKFNLSDLDLRTGISHTKDNIQYQLGARYRPVFLNGNHFADTLGIDGSLKKSIGPKVLLSLTATLENFNDQKNNARDRGLRRLSASITQKTNQTTHRISTFAGKENPKNRGRNADASSRDFIGLGYQLSRPWNNTHNTYLKLDFKDIKHQGLYPIYPQARKDDRYTVQLGHNVKISKKLNLVFTARHTDNNSNLELFDIEQNELKMGVRYAWK